MSLSKSETDIILNKANVALARSQRLVASWLPPQTADELSTPKTEEELQREEDEIFTAVPETLGVGAPLPTKAADGSWNRTELDSNDTLRKQLLGRNYKKVMAAKKTSTPVAGQAGTLKPGAGPANATKGEDEDDEEEGRTALVGKKGQSRKRKAVSTPETSETNISDGAEGAYTGDAGGESAKQQVAVSRPSGSKGKKKATSFLDEILAQRSKKRKK